MRQRSKTRTMIVSFFVVMLTFIITIDTLFYLSARNAITNDQKQEVEMLMNTIKTSIESTQAGEMLFEQALADNLRMASVAARYALPEKLEDVTTEQLVQIKDDLLIQDLTLFDYLEEEDDFVGAKSSDPKQIGMKTGKWSDGLWNQVFYELMTKQEATPIPNFGENLPHFWAGPYDTATSDPTKVRKWGYYNDGTTDYLIDPYIASDHMFEFNETAGVNAHIKALVDNVDFLTEVAVLNDKILQGEWHAPYQKDIEWHSERLVQFGTYNYESTEDLDMAKEAFSQNKQVHAVMTINGTKVLKSYIPITLETNVVKGFDRLIFVTTSDLNGINAGIKEELGSMMVVALVCLVIGGLLLWGVITYINRQDKMFTDVQNLYSENINSLFKSIKEHRHDFNNHIFTLTGLASMKKYDQMEEYLRDLSNIHTSINDIININIPAFSGLIQAKVAQASEAGVHFEHHFEGFDKLSLSTRKITDLVRVVGNIIDNALYAVRESNFDAKKVVITGSVKRGMITFQILNNGKAIPEDSLEKIFEHGFSTKPKTNNSGLGLAIVRQIIQTHKGNIEVTSNDLQTIFTIKIPISNREMLQVSA